MLADAIISGKSQAAIQSQQNAEGADKPERAERLQPA